jgi:hypothetical protein
VASSRRCCSRQSRRVAAWGFRMAARVRPHSIASREAAQCGAPT